MEHLVVTIDGGQSTRRNSNMLVVCASYNKTSFVLRPGYMPPGLPGTAEAYMPYLFEALKDISTTYPVSVACGVQLLRFESVEEVDMATFSSTNVTSDGLRRISAGQLGQIFQGLEKISKAWKKVPRLGKKYQALGKKVPSSWIGIFFQDVSKIGRFFQALGLFFQAKHLLEFFSKSLELFSKSLEVLSKSLEIFVQVPMNYLNYLSNFQPRSKPWPSTFLS